MVNKEILLKVIEESPAYKPFIEEALQMGVSRQSIIESLEKGLKKYVDFWQKKNTPTSHYYEWEYQELLDILLNKGLDAYLAHLP
ncbi:MAG: hypothetical protein QXR09_00480 [Candidatus Aenigmatarchaeota archaeon]